MLGLKAQRRNKKNVDGYNGIEDQPRLPKWIYLTVYFSQSSWHSQGYEGNVLTERFPVTDPRSERISAGPRRALHERAQQHYIGGGTEKTVVLK